MEQCEAATVGSDSVIIGDWNLDFNCWNDPTDRQKSMIEKTKSSIGSSGFHQVITGNTHTWPGARDSLIDHCWVNNPDKVISTINRVDAASDHNIVGIVLRISGTQNNCHVFKKRKWGDFDADRFNLKLSEIDWNQLYCMDDVNLIWDYMQSNILKILDVEAPVIKCQQRNNYNPWLSSETKATMVERDNARQKSILTEEQDDKQKYRTLRNKVTKEVRKDRDNYLQETVCRV